MGCNLDARSTLQLSSDSKLFSITILKGAQPFWRGQHELLIHHHTHALLANLGRACPVIEEATSDGGTDLQLGFAGFYQIIGWRVVPPRSAELDDILTALHAYQSAAWSNGPASGQGAFDSDHCRVWVRVQMAQVTVPRMRWEEWIVGLVSRDRSCDALEEKRRRSVLLDMERFGDIEAVRWRVANPQRYFQSLRQPRLAPVKDGRRQPGEAGKARDAICI